MKRKKNPNLSETLNQWLDEDEKPYEERVLTALTKCTNRSLAQTKFLYTLFENDLEKLLSLEEKIKANCLSWCPGDLATAEEILSMPSNASYFNLDEFRNLHKGPFISPYALSIIAVKKEKYDPKNFSIFQREIFYAVPGYYKVMPGTLPQDLNKSVVSAPSKRATFKVLGSDRKKLYCVSLERGKFSCDCSGFSFHKKCSHIEELLEKYGCRIN